MANMSYCRFRNTLDDLIDCYANWEESLKSYPEERQARERLLKLCQRIISDYGDDDE